MANPREHVLLGRIHGGEWGVHITPPDGGAFPVDDIADLADEIWSMSHQARRRNIGERNARIDRLAEDAGAW